MSNQWIRFVDAKPEDYKDVLIAIRDECTPAEPIYLVGFYESEHRTFTTMADTFNENDIFAWQEIVPAASQGE